MLGDNNFLNKWSFLEEKPLFIACSGGLDSMVLVEVFRQISSRVTVLHVNYHLRGEQSDLDESFVRSYCEKNGLQFECLSILMKDYLKENKGNLQEEARKIRYDWFHQFLENPDSYLLLGHHFDDQMETFYQRLARKSGLLGMACMLEMNGQIVRPLLNFRKEDLKQYALSKNLTWREDESNKSLNYSRNRLRNEFLPIILQQNPNLPESIAILIQSFQTELQTIENSINPLIKKIQLENKLELTVWRELKIEQRLSLAKSIGFNNHQLDLIEKLIEAQKGKKLTSSSHQVIKEDGYLSIIPLQKKLITPDIKVIQVKNLPTTFIKDELYLDADLLKGNLQIRPWKIGDRIAPIGVKGTQLISDIISDAKIPNAKRNSIFVLYDEDEIHWCVGLKIGRKAVASYQSKNIWKITVEE